MAKIRDPVRFSHYFELEADTLEEAGIFDPTLNLDTKLFIDPLLLHKSAQPEIQQSSERLRHYFEEMVALIAASSTPGDVAWREARRRFQFHEIAATCLGYGAGGIRGSAFGATLRDQVLATAKEIVALGVRDPDLFLLLPLLEEGVGPDRISDMVTNIILPDLAALTERLATIWGVPCEEIRRLGQSFRLPLNPTTRRRTPILLVPLDVLRHLPVATDWGEVIEASEHNAALRHRVNEHIGDIWRAQTRHEKQRRRAIFLQDREKIQVLLDAIHEADPNPYDLADDPSGLVQWRDLLFRVGWEFPRTFRRRRARSLDDVYEMVSEIVEQFAFLVEHRDTWRLLWHGTTPHKEEVSQRVFFAVAYSYCRANNLDITPEADTGSGSVDFKMSAGFAARMLVETKLSTNRRLVHGYETQLEIYRQSEETVKAIYLVVDVGSMGSKDDQLLQIRNDRQSRGEPYSEIVFVDGRRREPASRRT